MNAAPVIGMAVSDLVVLLGIVAGATTVPWETVKITNDPVVDSSIRPPSQPDDGDNKLAYDAYFDGRASTLVQMYNGSDNARGVYDRLTAILINTTGDEKKALESLSAFYRSVNSFLQRRKESTIPPRLSTACHTKDDSRKTVVE